MRMDSVTVAYALLFGLQLIPPAIGYVFPFPANVILTATLVVYIGCHLSLELPPEDESSEETETMSLKDALSFPVIGSVALLSLYLAIKYLGPYYVNIVLSAYFFVLGAVALGASLSPLLSRLLPSPKEYHFNLPLIGEFSLTQADIGGGVIGVIFATYYVKTKHYLANNVIGIAFSLQGIERTKLGGYSVGAILLIGLFFYDIYWVFFTPVMVGVAKNIDGPIKLLFPRSLPTADTDATFSMLGLGDIVLPGIFIALLLRYDAHRQSVDLDLPLDKRPSFSKTLFNWTLLSYTLGLVTTLVVMLKFQHAQPALLYLVPACLFSSFFASFGAGGVTALFKYSEAPEPKKDGEDGDAAPANAPAPAADSVDNTGGSDDDAEEEDEEEEDEEDDNTPSPGLRRRRRRD